MKEKIIEIIKNFCALNEEYLSETTRLKSISLDSLSFIDAMVQIEETFGIEFDVEQIDISSWNTIDGIIKETDKKINEKI